MAASPLRHPYVSVYGQRQTYDFNQHFLTNDIKRNQDRSECSKQPDCLIYSKHFGKTCENRCNFGPVSGLKTPKRSSWSINSTNHICSQHTWKPLWQPFVRQYWWTLTETIIVIVNNVNLTKGIVLFLKRSRQLKCWKNQDKLILWSNKMIWY